MTKNIDNFKYLYLVILYNNAYFTTAFIPVACLERKSTGTGNSWGNNNYLFNTVGDSWSANVFRPDGIHFNEFYHNSEWIYKIYGIN